MVTFTTELRGESVLVTYVDYGNSETIGKNELYQLPDELLKTPFQVSSTIPSTLLLFTPSLLKPPLLSPSVP